MGLALLVWVGGGLLEQVLYFFGNKLRLSKKSPIPHLPSAAEDLLTTAFYSSLSSAFHEASLSLTLYSITIIIITTAIVTG